ncbi:Imitation switch two complex protein 1 [Nakaseomyces bracarensis]|uniref:Imitation switch two complex protein 1 n=1 Tax=Nakaseomyces bracarensis TaxID=273131 RepID=A0ABR4NQI8_9SACH
MVLYKRKPIDLPEPKPLPADLNIQIWHIDETGEWFETYDDYLLRLDFYTRHQFTCEITGASCLTFFEALDSEESRFKYVEEKFPLKLREPVARFLHFNEIRRLDMLVEKVYARFKNDYFPGEVVYLRKSSSSSSTSNLPSQQGTPAPEEKKKPTDTTSMYFYPIRKNEPVAPTPQAYIIKEKVQFNASAAPNTNGAVPHTKYMLIDEEDPHKSMVADETQIYRDRSTFTKHLIKCFFKITFQKASYRMGAPWCVKPEYLSMYGLTMDWPPEMLKYKDDSEHNDTDDDRYDSDRSFKKRGRSSNNDSSDESESRKERKKKKATEIKKEEVPDSSSINEEPNGYYEAEQSVPAQETPLLAPIVPAITSIVDDMLLPYTKQPRNIFSSLSQYNHNLERLPITETMTGNCFPSFDKLLQINQFLNTFSGRVFLSHFTLEQFITSLKCTDQYELKGEIVYVSLKDDNNGINDEEWSDWKRNTQIRKLIKEKSNEFAEYKIVKDDPADDEMIDSVNSNGSALFVECFISLLRLVINENGDWTCLVSEEWLDDEDMDVVPKKEEQANTNQEGSISVPNTSIMKQEGDQENIFKKENYETQQHNGTDSKLTNGEIKLRNEEDKESNDLERKQMSPNGTQNISNEEGDCIKKSEGNSENINETQQLEGDEMNNKTGVAEEKKEEENDDEDAEEDILNKCLNYRNINWAERLSKRQFNNHNWILVLLGVYDDCKHIPLYSDIIARIFKKILPTNSIQAQLPRQLWRNFCRNLTLQDKVEALWILVDIVSNYCSEVRSFVDDSMELCGIIRSERFRVTKEMKSVSNSIYQTTLRLRALETEQSNNEPAKLSEEKSDPAENSNSTNNDAEVKEQTVDSIESVKQEMAQLEEKLMALQADKNLLDKKLMENDSQRLRSLGMDKYGNKIFWFELYGQHLDDIPKENEQGEIDWNKTSYQNGRVWIQGPHKDAAKFFLNLSEEYIIKWRELANEHGREYATRHVFHVFQEDGCLFYQENDVDKILIQDQEGNLNQYIVLSPIIRKIIDETPGGLLLSEDQWYAIDDYSDFEYFTDNLNQWGRKEHDLLKQIKPIQDYIANVYTIRKNKLDLSTFNTKEQKLLKELEDYEFTDADIALIRGDAVVEQEESEKELEEIERNLDQIAQKVMELDDSESTPEKKIEFEKLEKERDELLDKQNKILSNDGPGSRIMVRTEKKRLKVKMETKIEKQMEILTDLINNRHYQAMENVIAWKNQLAQRIWGCELRKNASGNKKNKTSDTVPERFDEIVNLTSRLASQ